MRWMFLVLCVASVLATPAMADGRNPFWGSVDKLIFISKTQFDGKSGAHALCVQVTDEHTFFIPTNRTAKAYAFSQTNCTTSEILPVPTERIPMLKAAGILSASVPDTPTAPLPPTHLGKIAVALIAMFFGGIGWLWRRPARRASCQYSAISGDPLFFDVLLTVMFHTARTDGIIENAELQSIMRVYRNLTGTSLTPDMAAAKFAQTATEEAVINLVKPYRDAQAQMLIDAAVQVATHSGAITREKKVLLTSLGKKLNHDASRLRKTIANALQGHRQPDPV